MEIRIGILKVRSLCRNRMRGVYWIDMAQDRDEWRALVYSVIVFFSIKRKEFLG
jgi:hypothetical protein